MLRLPYLRPPPPPRPAGRQPALRELARGGGSFRSLPRCPQPTARPAQKNRQQTLADYTRSRSSNLKCAPAHWPVFDASQGCGFPRQMPVPRKDSNRKRLPCPSGHSLTADVFRFAAFDSALAATSRYLSPLRYFLSPHQVYDPCRSRGCRSFDPPSCLPCWQLTKRLVAVLECPGTEVPGVRLHDMLAIASLPSFASVRRRSNPFCHGPHKET